MTYSINFRKRVFAVQEEEGLSLSETGRRFHVTTRTLFRWKKRIEPVTKRNKPATKIDMDALRKDIEKHPDRYQYERAKELGVTQGAIWFALKRLEISYKKNSVSSKSR